MKELYSQCKNAYVKGDWPYSGAARYSGFLVNHDQKEAVDLADYRARSVFRIKFEDEDFVDACVDPIPVLTENSLGWQMLFFYGSSWDSTEELAGRWCHDVLQIVDRLPKGYKVLNCVFAEARAKLKYNMYTFGTDHMGFVLNADGSRYAIAGYDYQAQRCPLQYVKVSEEYSFDRDQRFGVTFKANGVWEHE